MWLPGRLLSRIVGKTLLIVFKQPSSSHSYCKMHINPIIEIDERTNVLILNLTDSKVKRAVKIF